MKPEPSAQRCFNGVDVGTLLKQRRDSQLAIAITPNMLRPLCNHRIEQETLQITLQ